MTDVVFLVAFFHPALNRNALTERVRERATFLVRKLADEPTYRQFQDQRITPCPPSQQKDHTSASYIDFWESKRDVIPELSNLIMSIAQLCPTEASCERAFSNVKFQFNRFRTLSNPDLVEASTKGHSALNFFDNLSNDGKKITTTAKPFGLANAQFLLSKWEECTPENAPVTAAARKRDMLIPCKTCGKSASQGHDGRWISCHICGHWFANACAGLSEEDQPRIWNCLRARPSVKSERLRKPQRRRIAARNRRRARLPVPIAPPVANKFAKPRHSSQNSTPRRRLNKLGAKLS